MKLVKIGDVYVNPEHVDFVEEGMNHQTNIYSSGSEEPCVAPLQIDKVVELINAQSESTVEVTEVREVEPQKSIKTERQINKPLPQ